MLKKKSFVCICSLLCGLGLSSEKLTAFERYDIKNYHSQLYSDITPYELGIGDNFKPIYYQTQSSIDNYLYLGPNEVFFSPSDVLYLDGLKLNQDMTLSRGKEYTYIKNITRENDMLEWGIITSSPGQILADFFISASARKTGTTLSIQIDENEHSEIVITDKITRKGHFKVNLPQLANGLHTFKVKLVKSVFNANLKIFNVRLSGEGIKNSQVIRTRWRPEAVYSDWRSSVNPNDVKAWIMELSSDSNINHYSPIKTDFGYYGPIFKAEGARHMNMSIWSSSKNKDLLPLHQRSHLLGIGTSPDQAIFDKFGHEGSGVKVGNWNNFDTNRSKKYVIGLTYSDDGDLRTFSGYFWNEETQKWQLYAVGRKLITKPLESLKTKAFIEILGGPERERSGHKERVVKYKGWVRDSEGIWSDLDQINVKRGKNLTNKSTGITKDGQYFYASTGGFENQIPPNVNIWKQKDIITKRPIYMQPYKLKSFGKYPFIPIITKATMDPDGILTVNFRTKTRKESTVKICWGEEDAVTNQEFWDQCKSLTLPAGKGRKLHTVKLNASTTDRYVRLLVSNEKAQMWTFETYDLLR